MNVRRGGLGRGLGALIPSAPTPGGPRTRRAGGRPRGRCHGARFAELPVGAIEPNPRQPREVFDEEAMAELRDEHPRGRAAAACRRARDGARQLPAHHGRTPLAGGSAGGPGRACPPSSATPRTTRCCATRCWRTCTASSSTRWRRRRRTSQLLEDFGATHEELAGRIGRSRSHITNTLRLLNLAPSVQRRVAAGVLSAGHARALLGIDDHEAQERMAARIVAEGLSVRAVEEMVALGDLPKPAPLPACALAAGRPGRRRRRAVGPLRHPGQGRGRPRQGPHRHRVRDRRGPAPAARRDRRPRRSRRWPATRTPTKYPQGVPSQPRVAAWASRSRHSAPRSSAAASAAMRQQARLRHARGDVDLEEVRYAVGATTRSVRDRSRRPSVRCAVTATSATAAAVSVSRRAGTWYSVMPAV